MRGFIPLTLPYAGGHHPEQQKVDLSHLWFSLCDNFVSFTHFWGPGGAGGAYNCDEGRTRCAALFCTWKEGHTVLCDLIGVNDFNMPVFDYFFLWRLKLNGLMLSIPCLPLLPLTAWHHGINLTQIKVFKLWNYETFYKWLMYI